MFAAATATAAPSKVSSSTSSSTPLPEEEKLQYIKVSAFVDSVKSRETQAASRVPVLVSMTQDTCAPLSTEFTNDRASTNSCVDSSNGGESSKKRGKRARSTEKNGIDEQAIREHVQKRSKKSDPTRPSDGNGGKKPSKREATEDPSVTTGSGRVSTEVTYSPSSPDHSPRSSAVKQDAAAGVQSAPAKKSKPSTARGKRAATDSTGVADHDLSSSKTPVGAERAGATVSKADVHTTTTVVQDHRKKNAVSQTDDDDQVSPNAAVKKSGGGQSAVKSVASGVANGTNPANAVVAAAAVSKRKLSPTVADDSLFPDFEIIDPRIVEHNVDSAGDQSKKTSKSKRVAPVSLLRLELRSAVNRVFSPNETCSLFSNVYQKQPHLLSGVDIHVYGENGLTVAYGNSLFDSRGFSVVVRNYGTANSIKIGQVIGYLELRSMADKVKIY